MICQRLSDSSSLGFWIEQVDQKNRKTMVPFSSRRTLVSRLFQEQHESTSRVKDARQILILFDAQSTLITISICRDKNKKRNSSKVGIEGRKKQTESMFLSRLGQNWFHRETSTKTVSTIVLLVRHENLAERQTSLSVDRLSLLSYWMSMKTN